MFCNKCGKQLPDGSVFCDGCGASLTGGAPVQQPPMPQQPMYGQPQQPVYGQPPYGQQPYGQPPYGQQPYYSAPNPMFANFVNMLKGLFSGNAVTAVGNCAKSRTHEWALSLGAFTLLFGLSPMLFFKECFDFPASFKFFILFALLGAMTAATSALTIFVFMKNLYNKNISLIQALNVVGAATIPVSTVFIVNLLFGLMESFGLAVAVLLLLIAIVLSAILAYEGMQSFEPLGVKPFYSFAASGASVAIVVMLFGWLFLKIIVRSALQGMFYSMF